MAKRSTHRSLLGWFLPIILCGFTSGLAVGQSSPPDVSDEALQEANAAREFPDGSADGSVETAKQREAIENKSVKQLSEELKEKPEVRDADRKTNQPDNEIDSDLKKMAEAPPDTLPWDERIDRYEASELIRDPSENPDEMYAELALLLSIRATQFALLLDDAKSRDDPALDNREELEQLYPAADQNLFRLPAGAETVRHVHENYLALYDQRVRLLGLVSSDLRAEITGLQLFGMDELFFELRSVWLEIRYQGLRLPAAVQQLREAALHAPLPLIWFAVYLGLLVFVFRWWRGWFADTLDRIKDYLLAIRPRTKTVVSRVRFVWYLERVRKPVEWFIFFAVFFNFIEFLELKFVSAVTHIVINWILFAWFVVALVDSLVARSAGGAASDTGKRRLRSLRLVGVWAVGLGLSLDLSERLAGEGALYALVWRVFQILLVPLLFALLGMWREELFQRARREDREFMTRAEFNSQTGLAKYVGAAKAFGFLFAAWLRRLLLRRLVDIDPSRTRGMQGRSADDDEGQRISDELRQSYLDVADHYTGYARSERKDLVARIENGLGGRVVVIGERGIGKNGFLQQVCEELDAGSVTVDAMSGSVTEIEQQLADALKIDAPMDETAAAEAVEKNKIRIVIVRNWHMLVRPVMGGFQRMQHLADLLECLPTGIVRVLSSDRYAWQFIRRALGERATSVDVIDLQPWSDEQLADFLADRCDALEMQVDFTRVRVPSQFIEANQDSYAKRNRRGLFIMAASLAGGNPSIALRLLVDCLRIDEKGALYATLPANSDSRPVEKASDHIHMVLKIIAQSQYITRDDIVRNLRYPGSVVDNALRTALDNEWIMEKNNYYSLSWRWFRTITRVLARQNLLAGVK